MSKKPILALWLALGLFTTANATVVWDFEDGEDHRFALWSAKGALFSQDLPDVAGDERLTGIGTGLSLPDAGIAWTIGPPDQYDGLTPAIEEGCHIVNGVLQYGPCNDPFDAAVGDPPYDFTNSRGQSSYLNTYNLSQWGDNLHAADNDQIASSLPVTLGENAVLTAWAYGGGNGTHAPEYDADPDALYTDGSAGIAVIAAEDFSFLASVQIGGHGELAEATLDLSAFAGQRVLIEVVDAFDGGWGWLAVDEIQISNTSPPKIAALITADAVDLAAGLDAHTVTRLEGLGYEVQVVESGEINDTFTKDDANDLDLLVISESIGSSSADPLIGTSAPVMHQESFGWDNWGFITENASGWQSTSDANVVNDTHPIAVDANLPLGTVPFFTNGGEFTTSLTSILAPGAELLGQVTAVDGNDYSIVWAMEEGAERADGTPAPSRAVGFSLPGNPGAAFPVDHITDEAWAWFDACVRWLDPPPAPPGPPGLDLDVVAWFEAESGTLDPAGGTELQVFADTDDNDTGASGGMYIGSVADDTDHFNDLDGGMMSYTFSVPEDGDYILHGRVIAPVPGGDNNSFWVQIVGAGTDSAPNANGFVKWNNFPDGEEWYWQEVFNEEQGSVVVRWTLTAGEHTLNIVKREAGPKLDAIAIQKAD